ncbi:MAG: N-acetylmuramoyl-L-alanine amidase [Phycisphaeraceae bacterium]|nr:N-acetylmuramoyl-L-alanine amidase [Phycisphaeraceae bacterium]
MARRKSTSNRKGQGRSAPALSTRTRVVWGSLVASMTVVSGLLWVMDGAKAPRVDGWSMPALAQASAPSSIESVFATRAAMERGRWTSIVIHHSGSTVGSAQTIEAQHLAMNLKGLGHHFVIGNGRGAPDGQIHVGFRWLDQLPGAHVGGPNAETLNRESIGICLVGNGDRSPFTQAQVQRLVELVNALANELAIPADRIYLHSDVARTSDPGRLFPAAAFREQVAHLR